MTMSDPNYNTTGMNDAEGILTLAQRWSNTDPDNRTNVVLLRDDTETLRYTNYAGNSREIAKCVTDLCECDREIAHNIFITVTMFAHRVFDADFIQKTNRMCERIAELRRSGASNTEIARTMFDEFNE